MAKTIMHRATLDQMDDGTGYCRACGAQADSCEPDARNYKCESCDAPEVFGCEELLVMGELELVGEDDDGERDGDYLD
jgi:hypothetical protein